MLELEHEEPLSKHAFNFNLRRYNEVLLKREQEIEQLQGGVVQVETRVESDWSQRWN